MKPLSKDESRDIYRKGFIAGARGKTLDACRYRIVEKVNLWVRGFHEGRHVALVNTLDDQQRDASLVAIGKLRNQLGNTDSQ